MRLASRFVVASLPLALPLLFSACSPNRPADTANAPANAPGANTPAATTPASGPMKVALLVAGPISDAGWNASAYEGLQAIKKKYGAEVTTQQTKSPGEFEGAFRDFAQRGYQLVFAHGNEYGDAAVRVAKAYPKTVFAISSGGVSAPNVVSMVFDLGQATYLCGELGALMSKTGKLGCVGGVEIPSVKSTFISFEGGAKAAKPSTKVSNVYIGNWEDQSAGKQATVALINSGADFIFHNADQAGLGVIQAIRENKAKGVYGFGSNKNQNSLAPEVILASAVLDVPKAFLTVADEVKTGTVKGGPQYLGMKEGVVSLAWNEALKSRIPAAVLKRVQADEAAIVAGKLVNIPRGTL